MAPTGSLLGAPYRLFLSAALFFTSFFLATAIPAPLANLDRIFTANRVATYDDIPAQYGSIYKISDSCPNTLVLGQPTIDQRQVALLDINAIQEDSSVCAGSSPMVLVSEATVEQEGLLTALQLSAFRDALNVNQNAGSLINSTKDTSMLVGWHAGNRLCGPASYPETTIYFVIRETNDFRISFNRGSRIDFIVIPPQLKAMLIVTLDNTVCLLAERSSNPNADALLTSTENNETTTTFLVPFGSKPAPVKPPSSPSPTALTSSSSSQPSPTITPVAESEPAGPMPSTSSSPVFEAPISTPSEEELFEPSPSSAPLQPPMPDLTASVEPEESGDAFGEGAAANGVVPGDDNDVPSNSIDEVDDEQPVPSEDTGSEDGDDGPACFPAHAEVTLESGEKRMMAQLAVGDRVITADGSASDIILFTHSEKDTMNRFIRFRTECGRSLTTSRGHYVFANGGMLRAAGSLAIGDSLEILAVGPSRIVDVEVVTARGLYNPQTISGSIVVDEFKASAYTTAVDPSLAHTALLAPVRYFYSLSASFTSICTGMFEHGSSMLASMVPSGSVSYVRIGVPA